MPKMMLRAGSAALLSLALVTAPAHADYVGAQAGGGGNITYGAFAPTLNGVVTQLTKSVPVDPATGLAVPLATSTNQLSEIAALGAPADPAWSSGSGSLVALLKANIAATNAVIAAINSGAQASLPAGSANIGSVTANLGTLNGAATAAKQPALGTAGTPSTDVLSMQGILNGVPFGADTVVRSTSTDRGGTITTGGTAQQLMAANTARRGFLVQNQSSGDLYINCIGTAAASQTSLKIPAGALYESSPHHSGTGACSIFGATSAQAFYAREF